MSGIGNTGSGLETEEERKQKISALDIQTKQRIFTHQIKMDRPLVPDAATSQIQHGRRIGV